MQGLVGFAHQLKHDPWFPSTTINKLQSYRLQTSSAEKAIRIRVKMDYIWLLGHDENSPRSMGARHLALGTQE
jgi:hypothetical protein